MDKPSPPASPDYVGAAQQQGQNNIDMAKMTNPNVVTPYGTQTVSYGGPVEQNLMFAGHAAYRFKSDPFYSNGFIPTVKQLVDRIRTGA